MANLAEIRDNNIKINKTIQLIVDEIKKSGQTAFNQNGELHPDVRSIFEMEMKKFVLIYRSEFTNFECKEKLVVEAIEDKNEMDARGGADGIKVYSGMQRMLNGLLKKAGIEYTEVDDKVCATEVYKLTGGKDIEFVYKDGKHEYAEGIEPPQSVSEKMIDSNRDMLDYFAELLAHNKIDIEWMLDCLAHEAMHIFVPGKGVLVEGTTERLTRECADKYGLRHSPTAHQRETLVVSKLERIIGREKLAEIMSLSNDQKERRKPTGSKVDEKTEKEMKEAVDNERLDKMKKALEEKFDKATIDNLLNGFEEEYNRYMNTGKFEFAKYRTEYFSKQIEILDSYIENHEKDNPPTLYTYEKEDEEKTPDDEKLKSILELQGEELSELENILNKLQQKENQKSNQNQQIHLPSRKTYASKWSYCYKGECKRKCYN